MLVPELSVLLLFETARTAVPVALVAAVVEPTIDTRYDEPFIPTLTGPANDDVAVEVEITFPVIKRPCAVVDARFTLVVAVIFPNKPETDVTAEAKRFVVVAFVVVAFVTTRFVAVRFVIVATAAAKESTIPVVNRASVEKNDVDVAFVTVAFEELRF